MSHALTQQALSTVVVQAGNGDIFQMAQNWSNSTKTTAQVIAGALAVVFVIFIAVKTPSLGKVFGAMILGGFFFWGVHHVTSSTVQNPIDKTITGGSGTNGAPPPGVTFRPPGA